VFVHIKSAPLTCKLGRRVATTQQLQLHDDDDVAAADADDADVSKADCLCCCCCCCVAFVVAFVMAAPVATDSVAMRKHMRRGTRDPHGLLKVISF